jgi:N-glycosylase/DNA lyase
MDELLTTIKRLQRTNVRTTITKRINEFKAIDKHSTENLFRELCFCILTANFNAQRSIHIHAQLQDCFCTDTKETLAKKLKTLGYRFPATRAAYITEAAHSKDILPSIIHSLQEEDRRTWLIKNIKGLGYKEASHFLRNIGFDNYAIIDSHILDLLQRNHIIKQPKTLTKQNYLAIERRLKTIATHAHLTLAQLDLYLWYIETGKILK